MKVVNDVHHLPDGAWVLPTTAHSGAEDREIKLDSNQAVNFTRNLTGSFTGPLYR